MKKKIMLVASAGGHWVQLNRLLPAFIGCELVFGTTDKKYEMAVGKHRFFVVTDANRWNKLKIVSLALQMLIRIVVERPNVVISTGAAPGLIAIFIGKKLGAKTIWIDSLANVDEMSMSGKMAGKYSDMWLTQWEHLAKPGGPSYAGSVL